MPSPSAEGDGGAPEGTTDLSFTDPAIAGEVYDVLVEDDGQILVGGRLDVVQGDSRGQLVRIDPDGWLDPSFDPEVSGFGVHAITADASGRILIGGSFSMVGGVSQLYVARLQPDGTLDPTFASPRVNGSVNAIAVQPDGQIVIAGGFTHVGEQRQRGVARLNPDGSLDPSFMDPGLTSYGNGQATANAMVLNPDGTVIIGGNFRNVGGFGRSLVARLDPDGSLNGSHIAQVIGTEVLALAASPDGSVLMAGSFNVVNGQARAGLARFDPSGVFDAAFDAGVGPTFDTEPVKVIATQPDGRILIGGSFTEVGGEARAGLARLDSSGQLDPTLADPLIDGHVSAIAVEAGGAILAGGAIERVEGYPYRGLARILANSTSRSGDLDRTFGRSGSWWLTQVASIANDVAIEADGSVVAAGSAAGLGGRVLVTLTDPDGDPNCCFGRVAEGALTFNVTSGDDWAEAVAIQPDGKIVLAGHAGGSTGAMLVARLNTNGTRDRSFSGNGLATIDYGAGGLDVAIDLALQPDGRIVVAGVAGGGAQQIGVARLNPNGSPDRTFSGDGKLATNLRGVREIAYGVDVQPNGRIVVAGASSTGTAVVLRYLANGRLDPAFSGDGIKPISFSTNRAVATAVAVAVDGDIVVSATDGTGGGSFAVARLDSVGRFDPTFAGDGMQMIDVGPGYDEAWDLVLQPDGAIVVGGDTRSQGALAAVRLLEDGTPDPAFSDDGLGAYNLRSGSELAIATALQPDGRIILAGFEFGPTPHLMVARIWP